MNTIQEFDEIIRKCRKVFTDKLNDYGASWRLFRPSSLTDQLFIKAERIRTLETKGNAKIEDSIESELVAIVNYSLIGLIQLKHGAVLCPDMTPEQAASEYDLFVAETKKLLLDKNHDYDEAWRMMRTQSYTDFILVKINRIKQIEDNGGVTNVSEGIGSNYQDIINYAVFGLIKILESKNE